ncbi:MAG: NAD-dependent epimerase/dehydratase family protein [Chitinophagaceae bacterium]
MHTILITGGAGFVGTNLAISLKTKYPSYKVICMDNLKRRGSELNLLRLKEKEVQFIHGDIRNKGDFAQITYPLSCVIDAAAEPSVLAGMDGDTDYLIETNLNGTINALNFALQNKASFIFLSTSRVYPIKTIETIEVLETPTRFEINGDQKVLGVTQSGINEEFPLKGSRSLYGATKLASELMVEEYNTTFGLNTVVNRCGVLTGPYQMGKVDQGVVVLWMAKHFWNQNLAYIGYGGMGKQVRDILHVKDLFTLVDLQIHQPEKFNGEVFNVGGSRNVSASLCELTKICEEITGNKINIDSIPENRKADIRIYLSDNSKINNLTQWSPQISVNEIMEDIFTWIKQNERQLKPILS